MKKWFSYKKPRADGQTSMEEKEQEKYQNKDENKTCCCLQMTLC